MPIKDTSLRDAIKQGCYYMAIELERLNPRGENYYNLKKNIELLENEYRFKVVKIGECVSNNAEHLYEVIDTNEE